MKCFLRLRRWCHADCCLSFSSVEERWGPGRFLQLREGYRIVVFQTCLQESGTVSRWKIQTSQLEPVIRWAFTAEVRWNSFVDRNLVATPLLAFPLEHSVEQNIDVYWSCENWTTGIKYSVESGDVRFAPGDFNTPISTLIGTSARNELGNHDSTTAKIERFVGFCFCNVLRHHPSTPRDLPVDCLVDAGSCHRFCRQASQPIPVCAGRFSNG